MWPAELANHTRQSVGRHRSRSIVFQLAQSDIGELTLAPAQGQFKDYTGPVRRLVGACPLALSLYSFQLCSAQFE